MRSVHDHQWVDLERRFAVGSCIIDRSDMEHIRSEGITHVIDCLFDSESERDMVGRAGLAYINCPIRDNEQDVTLHGAEWFSKGWTFAKSALESPDSRILVHCYAGQNRGPSMLYAILRMTGRSLRQAQSMILSARSVATIRFMDHAERWVRIQQGEGHDKTSVE